MTSLGKRCKQNKVWSLFLWRTWLHNCPPSHGLSSSLWLQVPMKFQESDILVLNCIFSKLRPTYSAPHHIHEKKIKHYIYTVEYYSIVKNNVICNNIDGPRECHTEWSKSDREGEISHDIPCMWNLKREMIHNDLAQQKQTHGLQEPSLRLPEGRRGERDRWGVWY